MAQWRRYFSRRTISTSSRMFATAFWTRTGPTSPEWRMKETTANDDFERFRTGAAEFAVYLETPDVSRGG